MTKIRGSRVSVPDHAELRMQRNRLSMCPNEATLSRIRICARRASAILKYLEKRRNSPCRQVACFQRFLAKGEAGDLLDKWA